MAENDKFTCQILQGTVTLLTAAIKSFLLCQKGLAIDLTSFSRHIPSWFREVVFQDLKRCTMSVEEMAC